MPGLVWLGGYRSDMIGTKAEALDQWAAENGQSCLRHDYSGHGESGGEFIDGTISRWLEESLAVFEQFSMARKFWSVRPWVHGLPCAWRRNSTGAVQPDRLHALLLLAPAPDFTHELMLPELTDEMKADLETRGYMEEPSEYSDEPNIFTRALFDDGDINRVMTGPIDTGCPVHIMQGMEDPDVPYTHAMKLVRISAIGKCHHDAGQGWRSPAVARAGYRLDPAQR